MRGWLGIILTVALPLIAFAAPPVSGPFANRLSKIDIEQIQAAVSKERGISHTVRKIDAVRADKVAIQTGGKNNLESATYYDFTVSKRSGKWTIDTASIETSLEPTNNRRLDSDATGR
jgi:hypothetical protein